MTTTKSLQVIVWIGAIVLMFGIGLTMSMLIDGFAANSDIKAPTLSPGQLTATQLCVAATSAAGGYVLIWEIYGTPTKTPTIGGEVLTATPVPTEIAFSGDAERGNAIFNGVGNCASCHSTGTGAQSSIGPDLQGIAVRAANKLPGLSAAAYLRTVILDPSRVVPLTKPGVMPISYRSTLNEQQINDVITYLMTLK
ncbi:MAG: c-type cytochrome [Anaerolineae bacterium]|nr:c-type cytochrome [Anaerolineae bacterium]